MGIPTVVQEWVNRGGFKQGNVLVDELNGELAPAGKKVCVAGGSGWYTVKVDESVVFVDSKGAYFNLILMGFN